MSLYLPQTFDLLNIRPRKMNFVELCAEQALPFLHVNKKTAPCTLICGAGDGV